MEDNRVFKTGVKNFEEEDEKLTPPTSTFKELQELKYKNADQIHQEKWDEKWGPEMSFFNKHLKPGVNYRTTTTAPYIREKEYEEFTISESEGPTAKGEAQKIVDELATETLNQQFGKLMTSKKPGAFDRIGDWKTFNERMIEYLEIPVAKYSGRAKFNDLLHYTGLRVMCWHLLKYSLRVWLGFGKRHDFEKIAHFSQMAWTLAKYQQRGAPFFSETELTELEFIIKR